MLERLNEREMHSFALSIEGARVSSDVLGGTVMAVPNIQSTISKEKLDPTYCMKQYRNEVRCQPTPRSS